MGRRPLPALGTHEPLAWAKSPYWDRFLPLATPKASQQSAAAPRRHRLAGWQDSGPAGGDKSGGAQLNTAGPRSASASLLWRSMPIAGACLRRVGGVERLGEAVHDHD